MLCNSCIYYFPNRMVECLIGRFWDVNNCNDKLYLEKNIKNAIKWFDLIEEKKKYEFSIRFLDIENYKELSELQKIEIFKIIFKI